MISDKVANLVRTTCLASPALAAKVGRRVHPTEVALVESPVFPCVSFRPLSSSDWLYATVAGMFPFRFWVVSSKGWEEAYGVADVIRELFDARAYRNNSVRFAARMSMSPQEMVEDRNHILVMEFMVHASEV